jgi:hypothetical protein
MKVLMGALLATCMGVSALVATPARAESVIAGQCSALGDLSEQVVGWKNRGKTEAQAIAQTRKYYQDEADRKALATVVAEVYGDTRKKLIPEQVSMKITSECAMAMRQAPAPQTPQQ